MAPGPTVSAAAIPTPGSGPASPAPRSPATRHGRAVQPFLTLLSLLLLLELAAFVVLTLRWPLVGDAPLFHYIVFLTRHGWAPYRQIIDLNLPGTYAAQALVMRFLGESALAWRLYDLGLLLLIGLAMASICGPGRRFAALYAASLFSLIHGRDGLIDTGQRDLLMTALLLLGCAALIRQLPPAQPPGAGVHPPQPAPEPEVLPSADPVPARSHQSEPAPEPRFWPGLLPGLLIGSAATIKRLALLLLPAWAALLAFRLHSDGPQWRSPLRLALAGTALPLLALSLALLHWHAFPGFLQIALHLMPLHAGIFRWLPGSLLAGTISSVLLGTFLLWLPLFCALGQWRSPGAQALLAGFLFGLVSFLAQGRGYPYHRYPPQAFWLLLAGLAFQRGLRDRRAWVAALSVTGLLFGSLVVAPRSLAQIRRFDLGQDDFAASLGADLRTLQSLGRPSPDGHIQCLDQAGGCLAALYGARLLPSSGYLYDCYLFITPGSAAGTRDQLWYRTGFAAAWNRNPPAYVVVTSDECGLRPPGFGYTKLEHWPWLSQLLASQYELVRDHRPTTPIRWAGGGGPVLPYGYRIYHRLDASTEGPITPGTTVSTSNHSFGTGPVTPSCYYACPKTQASGWSPGAPASIPASTPASTLRPDNTATAFRNGSSSREW